MQQVLVVDITVNPIQLVVADVAGRTIELVDRRSFTFEPGLFAALNRPVSSVKENDAAMSAEQPEPEISYIPPTEQQLTDLAAVFNEFNCDPTASLLIIPAVDCFSLTMDLPFADRKLVKKIMASEVQDATPFPAEDFVLNYSKLRSINDGKHTFNISAVAKDHLARILNIFKSAGFDPTHVTTPAGILTAVPYLAPDFFDLPSAIITRRASTLYLTVCMEGRIFHERFLHCADNGVGSCSSVSISELKQSIASAERLFGTRLERVSMIGETGSCAQFSQALGREVITIAAEELVKQADPESGLSLMGAALVQDESPALMLSNFRSGEFSYGLQLRELKLGFKRLFPYFIAAFLTVVLSLVILNLFLSYQINRAENALRQEILQVVPSFPETADGLTQSLASYKNQLTERLGVLGSDTKYSPLDALAFISRDINLSSDQKIRVNRVRITGSQISLEGHASEASAIERLENSLRRKRKVYCRVKRPAISGSYNFSLEFHLCD